MLYCIVGVMAIMGNKLWQAAHLLAVVLVLSFTLASVKISGQALGSENAYFSLPLLFSVMVTVFAGILSRTKKTV